MNSIYARTALFSPSTIPCYLDGVDFYVRTNPATDKLVGPKLVEYVKQRFE